MNPLKSVEEAREIAAGVLLTWAAAERSDADTLPLGRMEDRSPSLWPMEPEDDDVDLRVTRSAGPLWTLAGMVRVNRPWRLVLGLRGALAANVATAAFGLVSSPAVGAIWLLTGATAAGGALTRAVTDRDESERTLAGMLLVRAGDRSVPVVTEAILSGRESIALIDVLASIGSEAARDALVRVSRAAAPAVDPVVAAAAAEALRTLDQVQGRERGNSRDI